MPRWRRAAFAARLRQGEPQPTFFTTRLNVGNYLWVSGESDYDEALIDAIIEYLQAHPITPGYDLRTYWQAFQASHR